MDVRSPWMPEDGRQPVVPVGGAAANGASATAGAADGMLRWRVNSRLTVVKIVAAVLFIPATVIVARDFVGVAIGALAVVVLAVHALRDILAPVRLAAGPTGVTVVYGFAGTRHIAWSQIERVRVDERRRLGVRSELLEVDAGESLHLFSGYELSASVTDVARLLEAMRTRTFPENAGL